MLHLYRLCEKKVNWNFMITNNFTTCTKFGILEGEKVEGEGGVTI